MSTLEIVVRDQFEMTTCYSCGCRWAMLASFVADRKRDHKSFWCPNGHQQHFIGETEETKLRRELSRAQQQIARADDEKLAALHRAAVAERETKRLQNRLAKGVCPCCNRRFVNLARHMATKHPDAAGAK